MRVLRRTVGADVADVPVVLFHAQCDRRMEARGSSRRNVGYQPRDRHHDGGCENKTRRINRLDAVQERGDGLSPGDRHRNTGGKPDRRDHDDLAQDQPEHVESLCAERNP